MTGWRLLLTRPAAECEELAAVLAAAGIHSSSLPLLETEALPDTDAQRATLLELDRYQAIIVVSKPAARLALERVGRYWPQVPEQPRWFSVGAATAGVLSDHGLTVSYPSQGDDSEALLALPELEQALATSAAPRALIMRGEGGRELIAQTLRERGVAVDYLELYRRYCPVYPADALQQRISVERLNALLVSSAQGLQHLQQLAADAWPAVARLPLLVPSPRVATLAREAGALNVIDCRGASAAAVLAALHARAAPPL